MKKIKRKSTNSETSYYTRYAPWSVMKELRTLKNSCCDLCGDTMYLEIAHWGSQYDKDCDLVTLCKYCHSNVDRKIQKDFPLFSYMKDDFISFENYKSHIWKYAAASEDIFVRVIEHERIQDDDLELKYWIRKKGLIFLVSFLFEGKTVTITLSHNDKVMRKTCSKFVDDPLWVKYRFRSNKYVAIRIVNTFYNQNKKMFHKKKRVKNEKSKS